MERNPLWLSGLVAIALTLALLIGNRFVLPVLAQSPYDVVILNGRVMDPETNFDGIRNVGIKDGRIATITEDDIAGDETIDATNHVVAPGFIDTHLHWTRPIGYKVALRDGVTKAMDLEAGVYGLRMDNWYKMHEGRSQMNYGTASGQRRYRTRRTLVPMLCVGMHPGGSAFNMTRQSRNPKMPRQSQGTRLGILTGVLGDLPST